MLFRFLFGLKERFVHPRLKEVLRECLPLDSGDAGVVADRARQKIEKVLRNAAQTVPYYRKLVAEGVIDEMHPRLEQFPIIGKSDIRGREESFISSRFGKDELERERTSGSTGEPFLFYRGKGEWDSTYAVQWRGLFRLGIRSGDRRVLVKGVDEYPNLSIRQRVRRWMYEKINRCILIDAHFLALSDQNVRNSLSRIRRYRPRYIHGYVSSIDLLATMAERVGIKVNDLGIIVVVTESEKLYDFQRERISRVFGCPVAENYGCVELGMIAQPDIDGNLCVNEDHILVEVDADGSAVYTNLDGYAFPFIRFKNGDRITVREKKKSKLPYRELEKIDGRMTDTIKLPQGGSLQGFIVMHPMYKHVQWLKAYQIYQPDIDHLIVRVVLHTVLPEEIRVQILSEMRAIVGPQIDIQMEICDTIPLSKRGKRLFICSNVKESF